VLAQVRGLDSVSMTPHIACLECFSMAHLSGRMCGHWVALPHGAEITCGPDFKQLAHYLSETRPDVFQSPPRVIEKLRADIQQALNGIEDSADRTYVRDAVAARLGREDGIAAVEDARLQTLLAPILRSVGLDRIKAGSIGGAVFGDDMLQFLRALGVPFVEMYGLSEAGMCFGSTSNAFRPGTAGHVLPGMEIRIADDGEILVRGEMVMSGYRKQPDATSAIIDSDGWVHTGDIGELDADGYPAITDRKKELMINAYGKNMSAGNIEAAIEVESELIGPVMAVGEARPYNTALITLNPVGTGAFAERLGLGNVELAELARHPAILAEVEQAVARGNQRLSRVEQVKRFTIVPDVWESDRSLMTELQKLKRRAIAERYATEIDALYAG
jgi:long-subunit acyl-CoA synthetase (AMP-forming)